MLQLRDIMTTAVATLTPDTSLRDAMELLATRHVSGAPVVAGSKVVGVVSATDLLDFALSSPDEPTGGGEPGEPGPAGELEETPGWDTGDDPPARYFTELWANGPVDLDEPPAEDRSPERNPIDEHTVGEVMTRTVLSLPPAADVAAAADFMRTANVHRILVIEHDRLVGIVTALDLAKAVADHRIAERTYVFGSRRGARGRGDDE